MAAIIGSASVGWGVGVLNYPFGFFKTTCVHLLASSGCKIFMEEVEKKIESAYPESKKVAEFAVEFFLDSAVWAVMALVGLAVSFPHAILLSALNTVTVMYTRQIAEILKPHYEHGIATVHDWLF